jgi:hypothetical protein
MPLLLQLSGIHQFWFKKVSCYEQEMYSRVTKHINNESELSSMDGFLVESTSGGLVDGCSLK